MEISNFLLIETPNVIFHSFFIRSKNITFNSNTIRQFPFIRKYCPIFASASEKKGSVISAPINAIYSGIAETSINTVYSGSV